MSESISLALALLYCSVNLFSDGCLAPSLLVLPCFSSFPSFFSFFLSVFSSSFSSLLPSFNGEGETRRHMSLPFEYFSGGRTKKEARRDPEWLFVLFLFCCFSSFLLLFWTALKCSFEVSSAFLCRSKKYISWTRRSLPFCGASKSCQCAAMTKGRVQVHGLDSWSVLVQAMFCLFLLVSSIRQADGENTCMLQGSWLQSSNPPSPHLLLAIFDCLWAREPHCYCPSFSPLPLERLLFFSFYRQRSILSMAQTPLIEIRFLLFTFHFCSPHLCPPHLCSSHLCYSIQQHHKKNETRFLHHARACSRHYLGPGRTSPEAEDTEGVGRYSPEKEKALDRMERPRMQVWIIDFKIEGVRRLLQWRSNRVVPCFLYSIFVY